MVGGVRVVEAVGVSFWCSHFCCSVTQLGGPCLEALCGLTLALHGYALDYALGYALGYAQRLGCSYPSGYPSQLVPGLSLLELSLVALAACAPVPPCPLCRPGRR